MGMVETRTFTSGAELVANYARIRQAVYQVKPKPIILVKPAVRINPDSRGKRPLWCLQDMHFDAHVKLFRAKFRSRSAPVVHACKSPVVVEQSPLWKSGYIHFNQHVVDFLHHKIAVESEGEVSAVPKKPIAEIISQVLQFFPGITIDHVRGACRTRAVVLPRQLCAWELKTQRPDLSYPEIGRRLGGKDHTSILHSVQKMQSLKDAGELAWYFNARDIE